MQWWRAALAALSLAAAAWGADAGGVGGEGEAPWQRGLLQALGLRRRPRVDHGKVTIPDAMLTLYNQLTAGTPFLPYHQQTVNTVRSFTHRESAVDRRFKGHHSFRLSFNISLPDDEWLKVAELVISRDSVNFPTDVVSPVDNRHRVLVYDIVKPGIKGVSKPLLRLLDKKTVRGERAGEVKLDVTAATERWMWRPSENFGLLVQVIPPEGVQKPHVRLRRSVSDSPASWRAKQPVLLAYTDDGRTRAAEAAAKARGTPTKIMRSKRSTRAAHRRPHRRKDGRDLCQRHPLYVDFNEVGWTDWILAPPGYEAHYCHGDCPFPLAEHLNSTNHAIVQTLVNSVNPRAVPKACCVPTDLSSMSMLYMDEENKVVLKNYQDMSVVSCGCR